MTTPNPVTSDEPPSPPAGLDPCELVDTDQATQLGLQATARTDYMTCS
jgi:hypothetical protein